jgi:hypothetical protein
MRVKSLLAVLLSTAMVAGCAEPLVDLPPISFQYKVQHVRDWRALADRAADTFAASLHTTPPNVFVAPGPSDMPFAEAYRDCLEQSLMKRGFTVVRSAAGAEVISFNVRTYLYGEDNQRHLVQYASFWTVAAALGWGLHHVSSVDTAVAAGLAAGAVADVLWALNDRTRAEVMLTTTVVDNETVHYLDNQQFFVRPSDLTFYWSQQVADPQAPEAIHVDKLSTVALPVVAARY